jgi:phosphohistidine swiveling domain-containing protein
MNNRFPRKKSNIKMSYKKYKWNVLAVDYNAPFIRNYIWTCSFLEYPKLFEIPQLLVGINGNKEEMHYIGDLGTWQACHDVLKKRALADPTFVDWIIDQSFEKGEAFDLWCQKEIHNRDLTTLSGKEIIDLLLAFIQKQKEMYAHGVLLPVLDFQKFSFVEGNLKKILQEKLSEEQFADAYAVFTTPLEDSFQRDQEEDLLQLMQIFQDREGWKEAVMNNDLDKLNEYFPDFMSQLHDHALLHGWVYYVYAGPPYTEKEFLDFIRDYLKKQVNPQKQLDAFAAKKQELVKKQKNYLREISPNDFENAILRLASKVVYGKPRRKDYQSKAYWYCEKVQCEIGSRLSLTLEEVRFSTVDMLEKALVDEKAIDKNVIKQIMDCHVCLPNDDGTITILYGQNAKDFSDKLIITEDNKNEQVNELKGMCACVGKARGNVKIINHAEEMRKMNYGDILVSAATTPAIVTAMKKAAAIITDEGGLTCHAAIVSRELEIPCVVGLKTVTKAFKDGDLVEVDATNGVVRKVG